MKALRPPYLDPHRAVQNADQEDVLHHQPARHGRGWSTGTQEDAGERVVHVLPAVGHVQLLQLPTYGGHVRLTQPADSCQDRAE